MRKLRSQHGIAITPADPRLVEAVTERLSSLAKEGESFTTPDIEETGWAIAFVERAVDWTDHEVRLMKHRIPNACHDYSSEMALRHPRRYSHVFGWALNGGDNDTHWRTHSWVHDLKTDELIEHTSTRRAYIGVEL